MVRSRSALFVIASPILRGGKFFRKAISFEFLCDISNILGVRRLRIFTVIMFRIFN